MAAHQATIDVVAAFGAAQGWQLSPQQCFEYAVTLEQSEATTPEEQALVLSYIHTEKHLVQALQDSNHPDHAAALGEVQAQCLHTIRLYSYHWKKDSALDEEDICQLALLRTLEKIKLFKYRSAFRTWITRIVINESLQLHRRQNTQSRAAEQESIELHGGLQSQQESVIDVAINNVERIEFEAILRQQTDQRLLTVFAMYVDQDATLKQIGDYLHLKPSRVHSLLKLVRDLFRGFRANPDHNPPQT
ncbi:MAG: sigma-70 family RNA polymerase sigma factor [Chloroflexi bacterium]|nr:sigma-70 family RNA polymerase sigma factor [Chloroflexota bacterium]